MTSPDHSAAPPAQHRPLPAAPVQRIIAQTVFEARMILRNGEQLMITVLLPVILLIGLVKTDLLALDTGELSRVDFVTPGILALAVMTTAFTSQAIATAFDRRNGVLRLLATTPLGRGGLLISKIFGVLAVEAVQVAILTSVALTLGWQPAVIGVPLAVLAALLGTAAFTSLALLVAGTLRAEGVLALANILLIGLIVAGGVILPVDQLPGPLAHAATFLPSGALGEAMRGALLDAAIPPISVVVLVAWTGALGWGAGKLFRWQ